jgi:hypothetical protein
MCFDGLCHAAESREGQTARFIDRNALRFEFLCGFGDVRVDLSPEVPFASRLAANQTEQARHKNSQCGHELSS